MKKFANSIRPPTMTSTREYNFYFFCLPHSILIGIQLTKNSNVTTERFQYEGRVRNIFNPSLIPYMCVRGWSTQDNL